MNMHFAEHFAETSDHLIRRAVEQLSPREQAVLNRRFGLDGSRTETLQAIAEDFGVSRNRVLQIQQKAIRKLKHPSRLGARIDSRLSPPSMTGDVRFNDDGTRFLFVDGCWQLQ